jgi:hypothetical protein
MSANMAPTRDGGAVISFALFRTSRTFPRNRFAVVALDRAGCVLWRASLPGGWPISRPVQASDGSIVAASAGLDEPGAAGGVRVYTLSASTGRVLQRTAFPTRTTLAGRAPALIAGPHGAVGVLAGGVVRGAGGTFHLTTVMLLRRGRATGWSRRTLDGGSAAVATAARADGRLVIAFARRGRLLVRTATLAGAVGPLLDAGPLGGNFRSAAVALNPDGAIAAAWQSSTYGAPWRVRAAVRPARAARFARFRQIGFTPGRGGTLYESSRPGVRLDARGRATVGFELLAPPAGPRTLCAGAPESGRFGTARLVASGGAPASLDRGAMTFGATGSNALAIASAGPDLTGFRLATVGAGCRPGGSTALDPAAGVPAQALVDRLGRPWVLGQPCCRTNLDELREPITLTIGAPMR